MPRSPRAMGRSSLLIAVTPSHVLLTFEEYQRLTSGQASIIDLLGLPPGVEEAELETPRTRDLARPADLG